LQTLNYREMRLESPSTTKDKFCLRCSPTPCNQLIWHFDSVHFGTVTLCVPWNSKALKQQQLKSSAYITIYQLNWLINSFTTMSSPLVTYTYRSYTWSRLA